jgi:hypothetical protein
MSKTPEFPMGCGQSPAYPHLSTGNPSYPQGAQSPVEPGACKNTPNGRLDSIHAQVDDAAASAPGNGRSAVRWCLEPGTSPFGKPIPCRKCSRCLWIASRRWMRRAEREFHQSGRTWWITLTVRPGADPAPTYRDVSLWLRRVRMKLDPSIRYLVREETGERFGRLHWHVLLHCSPLLQRRSMQAEWKFGHFHARLAKTPGLAAYMAKYQAKADGKFRPSIQYGKRLDTPNAPILPENPRSHRRGLKHRSAVREDYRHSREVQKLRDEVSRARDRAHALEQFRTKCSEYIQAHKDAPLPRPVRARSIDMPRMSKNPPGGNDHRRVKRLI